jgi:hypothetical protein
MVGGGQGRGTNAGPIIAARQPVHPILPPALSIPGSEKPMGETSKWMPEDKKKNNVRWIMYYLPFGMLAPLVL